MSEFLKFITYDKVFSSLIYLNNHINVYQTQITRGINTTSNHMSSMIKQMEEYGLIRRMPSEGNKLTVFLTDKGRDVANKLQALKTLERKWNK